MADNQTLAQSPGSGDNNPENWSIVSNAESRARSLTMANVKEVPATKEFAINATGNLFVATTLNSGNASGTPGISQQAANAFGEVSVFFAAMTKAMSESGTSFYDISAINKIVSDSGLFVKVTESDIKYTSSSWGVTFGSELITALLGFSGGLASVGSSLMQMLGDIGKQGKSITISHSGSKQNTKVGTIVFVCEYLLGAVSITPIVLSMDAEKNKQALEAGPCFKTQSKSFELNIEKTTYLFVPPSFIPEAQKLNNAMDNPNFNDLVNTLKATLSGNAKDPTSKDDISGDESTGSGQSPEEASP